MYEAAETDQAMRERIEEDCHQKKQKRRVWIIFSLARGLISFLLVNGLGYLTHRYKFGDIRELVWLSFSFLFWVGGSYALGEWRWRKNERAKISQSSAV